MSESVCVCEGESMACLTCSFSCISHERIVRHIGHINPLLTLEGHMLDQAPQQSQCAASPKPKRIPFFVTAKKAACTFYLVLL